MSGRGRLAFAAACLLAFAVLAGFVVWSGSSSGPSRKTPVTVTLAPGAARPAGLTVADLDGLRAALLAGPRQPVS